MAYYQGGKLVLQPGDEGHAETTAPAQESMRYCFDDEH